MRHVDSPVLMGCTAALLSVAMLACLASAQSDTSGPVLRKPPADAKETPSTPAGPTTLFLAVRDKKNKPVADLTKDDLTINDDGQPQQIQEFGQAGERPLVIGLLVETSAGERSAIAEERAPCRSFFGQAVQVDRDKAFVIHFDREVELLQDLTASQDKLGKAIDELNESAPSSSSSGNSGPTDEDDPQTQPGGRRMRSTKGAQLYDAIYLASNEILQKESGRKVVVVISAGVDHGSKESLVSAVEAAQRAHAIVYTVLVKDENENQGWQNGRSNGSWGIPGMGGPMGRPGGRNPQPEETRADPKKTLQQISTATGGEMFESSKKMSLDQIYSQIEDQLRHEYAVSYVPTEGKEAGDYHTVKVVVKKSDLTVLAPTGYYPATH